MTGNPPDRQGGRRSAPRGRTLRWVVLAGFVLAVAPATSMATTYAASPSPDPASAPNPLGSVEAWLDAPIQTPADMPPDGIVEVGITFWDAHTHRLTDVNGVELRLYPAKGKAAPTLAEIHTNWPGHILADLALPKGGAGKLELGSQSRVCTSDGTCKDQIDPIPFAGVGPPADASLAELVSAQFHSFVGDTVAGRTFPVAVDMVAMGNWNADVLTPPDSLVVTAAHPGGPELARATLILGNQPGAPYAGHLTIAETGPVDLEVAIPGVAGAADEPIVGVTAQLNVIQGGRPASASAAPADPAVSNPAQVTSTGEIPLAIWVVGIGALLVVVGLVLRRVLADL
jgi:hypothetical protein